MLVNIRGFFDFLAHQHIIALSVFFIFLILITKLIEPIKILKSDERDIALKLILTGGLLLIVMFVLKLSGIAFPFTWLIGSCGLVGGGILGMFPYSFLNKKNKK